MSASRQQKEIWALVALLAIAGLVLYRSTRTDATGTTAVFAGAAKFQPLKVQEPQLRLDLLEKLQKSQYTGMHRDIFSATPVPSGPTPAELAKRRDAVVFQGPRQPPPPPPPPPLSVPAQFFGYASMDGTGKRVAFLSSGDNVLVVAEGDTFLSRFRMVHVGDNAAYVEEISSGRHATLQIVPPPPGQGSD